MWSTLVICIRLLFESWSELVSEDIETSRHLAEKKKRLGYTRDKCKVKGRGKFCFQKEI